MHHRGKPSEAGPPESHADSGDASSRPKDLHRLLVESARGHAIFALDRDGRIITWSPGAERLFGYAEAEIVGRSVAVLSPEPESGRPQVLNAATEQDGDRAEQWHVRRDGGRFWAEVVTTPMYDDDGAVAGFAVVVDDRTERHERDLERDRLLERARRERGMLEDAATRATLLAEAGEIFEGPLDEQQRFDRLARLVVSTLADWCLIDVIGSDRRIRRVAGAHRNRDREGLVRALLRFPPVEERPAGVSRVLRTGRPELTEQVTESGVRAVSREPEHFRTIRELGAESSMIVPLIARGHVLGAITIMSADPARRYGATDLTIAQELARRAAVAIDNAHLFEESQEASRAKSDFLAVISHELRTPLNAIMGYADLLDAGVTGELNEQQREKLSRIRLSAHELARLIEEILAFARMEAGREAVQAQRVDGAEMARHVARLMEPVAIEHGLGFHIDVPEEAIELETDESKLRQVLMHLLSNAIKFTPEGRVGLAVRYEADRVCFDVSDTGIGIDDANRERVFEAFWQAEGAATRRVGGTGLGLTAARRLVGLLNGEIRLRSTRGEGTTFTVELPRRLG